MFSPEFLLRVLDYGYLLVLTLISIDLFFYSSQKKRLVKPTPSLASLNS